jgi:hypothetical protein
LRVEGLGIRDQGLWIGFRVRVLGSGVGFRDRV